VALSQKRGRSVSSDLPATEAGGDMNDGLRRLVFIQSLHRIERGSVNLGECELAEVHGAC